MSRKFPSFEKDYEFFINEEKEIVVAKLDQIENKFWNAISKAWKLNDPMVDYKTATLKDYAIRDFINSIIRDFFEKRRKDIGDALTAKATCDAFDDFDAAVGMHIAERKLEIKVQEMWFKLNLDIEIELDKLWRQASSNTDSVSDYMDHRRFCFIEDFGV